MAVVLVACCTIVAVDPESGCAGILVSILAMAIRAGGRVGDHFSGRQGGVSGFALFEYASLDSSMRSSPPVRIKIDPCPEMSRDLMSDEKVQGLSGAQRDHVAVGVTLKKGH